MGKSRPRSTDFFDQDAEGSSEPVVFVGKRSGFVPQENIPGKHPSPEDICILCEEALATKDEEVMELVEEIMEASRCGSKVVIHVVNIHPVILEGMALARPLCCSRR